MLVTLDPKDESVIHDAVSSGKYRDAAEVVHAALRIFAEQEERARLRESLERATQDMREGRGRTWSEELRAELWERAVEHARAGKPPKRDILP